MDMKKLLFSGSVLSLLYRFITDNNGNMTAARGALVIVLILLTFYLFTLLIIIRIYAYILRALFVRGEPRKIRGDGPLARRTNVYRLLARAVDYALIIGLAAALVSAVDSTAAVDASSLNLGVVAGAGLLYFPALNSLTDGQTVGKALFGLETVSTVGQQSIGQLLLREGVFLGSVVATSYIGTIYVVMKNEQSEHPGDIVADTQTVAGKPSGLAGLGSLYRRSGLNDVISAIGGRVREGNNPVHPSGTETVLQGNQDTTALQRGNVSAEDNQSTQQTNTGTTKSASGGGTDVYDNVQCLACGNDCPPAAGFCPECGNELSD